MEALSFEAARASILHQVAPATPETEIVSLAEAAGRVLAEPLAADRDYPPTARSARDGFALHSADLPGRLRVIGEIRAGTTWTGRVERGAAVEIMTGAPMPEGPDQVVMVEHTTRDGEFVLIDRPPKPGDNFNPRGWEAQAGEVTLPARVRIGYPHVALLASYGKSRIAVYRRPRVAILATGDELVNPDESPRADQIRNSNAWSLHVQVARAGALPEILPIARDNEPDTRALIEQGLQYDLLLLSGGVSMGKYDVVERVLASLGAEFYFDRVKIQPGQPLVFGRARETFFFGLPGNPLSTMVTFDVFARAALERLGGILDPQLLLAKAQLTAPFHQRPGLTRFLPAHLDHGKVTPGRWHGSADIPALARANCYLVSDPDREAYAAGDSIRVMPL